MLCLYEILVYSCFSNAERLLLSAQHSRIQQLLSFREFSFESVFVTIYLFMGRSFELSFGLIYL